MPMDLRNLSEKKYLSIGPSLHCSPNFPPQVIVLEHTSTIKQITWQAMALSFHVFADKIEENKKSWKAKKMLNISISRHR